MNLSKLQDANPLFSRADFYVQVQEGKIPGYSLVHKFGRNDAVPNATWEFINLLGFTGWPLSAATKVRVKAGGDAADTAGGAGAVGVSINGIDGDGNDITEVVATAGALASGLTDALFFRVHRSFVSGVGTYGVANTGNVIIENGGGGTDLIKIAADEGQTQFGGFTMPIAHKAYLLSAFITVDGVKPADIRIFTRDNAMNVTAPMSSKRLRKFFDGVLGELLFEPVAPWIKLNSLTDIWAEARGSGAQTEASVDFELLLIQDDFQIQ